MLLAIGLGVAVNRAHSQRRAIEAFSAFRCPAFRYYTGPPNWLGRLTGNQDCFSVRSLQIGGPDFTNSDVVLLEEFPDLVELSLLHSQVTDDGLGFLQKLPNLELLILSGDFSEKAIDQIALLPNLKYLDVSDAKGTWQRVKKLKRERAGLTVVPAKMVDPLPPSK